MTRYSAPCFYPWHASNSFTIRKLLCSSKPCLALNICACHSAYRPCATSKNDTAPRVSA